jgi:hypothetical protein
MTTSADRLFSAGKQLHVKQVDLWDHSFYFQMSLLLAAVVVYGFSRTINGRLIHPPSPPPLILYFHAVLFTSWLLFFIVQSDLVRTRNVKVHRKLGWFGLAMGVAMAIVGIATAIVMTRLRIREGVADAAAFMIVPLFDTLAFSVSFGLAFYWRTRPEFHRRLILMASCALTAAAFGRFPRALIPAHWLYAGVDVLIVLGIVRDLIVTKHVHPVYLYGLPLMMLGQVVTTYTFVKALPEWLTIARALLG